MGKWCDGGGGWRSCTHSSVSHGYPGSGCNFESSLCLESTIFRLRLGLPADLEKSLLCALMGGVLYPGAVMDVHPSHLCCSGMYQGAFSHSAGIAWAQRQLLRCLSWEHP